MNVSDPELVWWCQANLGKHSLVGDKDLERYRDVFRSLMNPASQELKVRDASMTIHL